MSKARGLRGRFCQLFKNRLTGIADLGRKADRNARALKAIPEGLQAVPEWLQWLKVRELGLGSVRSVERPIEAANSHCRIDESGRSGGGNCAADHPLDGRDSRAWNEPEIQIERACEFDQAGQADIAPAALDLRNVALRNADARTEIALAEALGLPRLFQSPGDLLGRVSHDISCCLESFG